MAQVLVRAIEPDDFEAVNEIHNQLLVAANTTQIPYTSLDDRRVNWHLPSPRLRSLVAELDGQVVGNAGLELYDGRRAHAGALGMGVDARYHNRGVGRALMEAIIDLADNWYGLYRLELEVYTGNAAAIHLYQRFGFEVEGLYRALVYRTGAYADAYAMARMRRSAP